MYPQGLSKTPAKWLRHLLAACLFAIPALAYSAAPPAGFILLPGYTWDGVNCIDDNDSSIWPSNVCLIPAGGGGGGGGGGSPTINAKSFSMTHTKALASAAASSTSPNDPLIPASSSTQSPCVLCPLYEGLAAAAGGQNQAKNVKPALIDLSSEDFFIQSSLDYSVIAADASMLGVSQKLKSWSLVAGMRKDFDNWGFALALPVNKTLNNDAYSDLDSTSVGIQFAPRYHFLVEQVHWIGVDVGAQVGYSHVWYDDLSSIQSAGGAFGFANFENTSTANYGVTVNVRVPIGEKTSIRANLGAADYVNFDNESVMGRRTSTIDLQVMALRSFSQKLQAFASLSKSHLRQHSFDNTYNYGMFGLGALYQTSSRGMLTANAERSFADGYMQITRGTLQFSYSLD